MRRRLSMKFHSWCILKLVRVWRGGGRGGGGRGGRGSGGLRVKVSRSNNICVQDVHSAKFSFGNRRNWIIRCDSNTSTWDDSPCRLIHSLKLKLIFDRIIKLPWSIYLRSGVGILGGGVGVLGGVGIFTFFSGSAYSGLKQLIQHRSGEFVFFGTTFLFRRLYRC